VDPCVIEDGHTYERFAILKWFQTGKTRSPVTNEELESQSVIRNISLRKLIQAEMQDRGRQLVDMCANEQTEDDFILGFVKIGLCDLDYRDINGNTSLLLLLQLHKYHLVLEFIELGAGVTKVNHHGQSILDVANLIKVPVSLMENFLNRVKLESDEKKQSDEMKKRSTESFRAMQNHKRMQHKRMTSLGLEQAQVNINLWDQTVDFFPSLFNLQFQQYNSVDQSIAGVSFTLFMLLSSTFLILVCFI